MQKLSTKHFRSRWAQLNKIIFLNKLLSPEIPCRLEMGVISLTCCYKEIHYTESKQNILKQSSWHRKDNISMCPPGTDDRLSPGKHLWAWFAIITLVSVREILNAAFPDYWSPFQNGYSAICQQPVIPLQVGPRLPAPLACSAAAFLIYSTGRICTVGI